MVLGFVMTLYKQRYYGFVIVFLNSISFLCPVSVPFNYFSGGLSPKLSALTGPWYLSP
jgi:hypothetical protein